MKRKMYKTIIKAVKVVAFIGVVIALLASCAWYATHYTREATVTQATNDGIIVIDTMNKVWLTHNDNDYQIDDKVKLVIYTNNTDLDTTDDRIEVVKKIK